MVLFNSRALQSCPKWWRICRIYMAKKIKDTLVETPKVSYATKIPGETDLWIGSGYI